MSRAIAALTLLVCACSSSLPFEPAGPDAAPDPGALGPFDVGVKTVVFLDPTRPKADGQPRRLITEIWYPAEPPASDAERVRYPLIELLPPERVPEFAGVELGDLATEAVRDAPPRTDHAPYPIIFFSHGNAAVRMQSTFLTVAAASHGYVVVSPDHEGNTLGDVPELRGEDGRLRIDYGRMIESLADRPKDLSFLLDRLALDEAELRDLIAIDDVGVVGHSFGAVTALRWAALDPRVDACVSQSPASYLISWLDMEVELSDVRAPVMLMGGEIDLINPADPIVTSVWEETAAPGYYLRIADAGHFTFSDFCVLNRTALIAATEYGLGDIIEDGCGPSNSPPERAYPLIDHFSIGLFNRYLRHSEESEYFLRPEAAAAFGEGSELLLR